MYEYVITDDDNYAVNYALLDESPFNTWNPEEFGDDDDQVPLPDGSIIITYDLVTIYNVLKNRKSCKMESFAKKAVIDSLDYMHDHTQPEKLYLYLLCNAKIMGFNTENNEDNVFIRNVDDMYVYIDPLYYKIRKYLDILDDTNYVNQPKYILKDIINYNLDR